MKFNNLSMAVIEDDKTIRETLSDIFRKEGFSCFTFDRGKRAIKFIKGRSVDVVILDLRLPDINGLDVLKSIKEIDEELSVIIMTAYPEVETAISALKEGAYDYINKPFELEELRILVGRIVENRYLKSKILEFQYQRGEEDSISIVGKSQGIREVMMLVKKVAATSKTPVLITGESGVGKELVARAIHRMSSRAERPFIKVNCTALPDTLLESELFGYEKGAFTDARSAKKGLFELANGGTIFLDEIGDLRLDIQPKLLQVLEAHTFRKIGGLRDITVDVRIITATNQDLKRLVKEGGFRSDLYYRLNVFTIFVPPLRERVEDILPIAEEFLRRNRLNLGKVIKGFSKDVEKVLVNYPWPGNVRELKNLIERSTILATGDIISLEDIPHELKKTIGNSPASGLLCVESEDLRLNRVIEEVEKAHIQNVLTSVKNNKSTAARLLGISRYTLREKIKKYNIAITS